VDPRPIGSGKYIIDDLTFKKLHLGGETVAEQWLAHWEDSEGVLSGLKFILHRPHPKMPDKILAGVIVAQGRVIVAKTCSPGSNPSVIVIAQAKRMATDYDNNLNDAGLGRVPGCSGKRSNKSAAGWELVMHGVKWAAARGLFRPWSSAGGPWRLCGRRPRADAIRGALEQQE